MKTPEEYLQRLYITKDGEPESIHDSVENILDIFKQIQKDAWNEALDKAAESADVTDLGIEGNAVVDLNSILKLKIK